MPRSCKYVCSPIQFAYIQYSFNKYNNNNENEQHNKYTNPRPSD